MSACSRAAVANKPTTVANQNRAYAKPPSWIASCCWSAKTALISRPKCSRNSRGSSNSRKEKNCCARPGFLLATAINASGVLRTKYFLGSRHSQNALQSFGFGFCNLVPQLGEAVVAAPFVIESKFGAMFGFLDQLLIQQSLDDPVKSSGAQPNFLAGSPRNLLTDDVAMFLTVRQRQQNVEHGRAQRQKTFRCFLFRQWRPPQSALWRRR